MGFKTNELYNNIPKDIKCIIISYISDIILTLDNKEEIHINEEDFRDYYKSSEVKHIYFFRSITINDNIIFNNYKYVESIFGTPPIIKTKDLSELFGSSALSDGNLNEWDVSEVTNMSCMFSHSKYNNPLNNWDVSKVTDMSCMFSHSKYNKPLNKWDVSNVTDMNEMFISSKYDKPLNCWDVSNVTNMNAMFAFSQYNKHLNKWDVSKVTIINDIFYESKYNHRLNWMHITNMRIYLDKIHHTRGMVYSDDVCTCAIL